MLNKTWSKTKRTPILKCLLKSIMTHLSWSLLSSEYVEAGGISVIKGTEWISMSTEITFTLWLFVMYSGTSIIV